MESNGPRLHKAAKLLNPAGSRSAHPLRKALNPVIFRYSLTFTGIYSVLYQNESMKTSKITLLALLALSLFACKKKEELVKIDTPIPYTEELEIPFGAGSGIQLPVGFPTPDMDYTFATNYQTYLTQYNTKADLITSAKLEKFSMRITAPAAQNLDFIDTVRFYIFADNQPMKLIAYKYAVPKGLKELNMDIKDEELKSYFLDDSVHVRLNGYANAIPAGGTRMELKSIFRLKGSPLN
jgi:hypothetical protein